MTIDSLTPAERGSCWWHLACRQLELQDVWNSLHWWNFIQIHRLTEEEHQVREKLAMLQAHIHNNGEFFSLASSWVAVHLGYCTMADERYCKRVADKMLSFAPADLIATINKSLVEQGIDLLLKEEHDRYLAATSSL